MTTRIERLNARYTRDVAAVKRAEVRLSRAFTAWQRARYTLKSCEKLLEAEPVQRSGPWPLALDKDGKLPQHPFDDSLATL